MPGKLFEPVPVDFGGGGGGPQNALRMALALKQFQQQQQNQQQSALLEQLNLAQKVAGTEGGTFKDFLNISRVAFPGGADGRVVDAAKGIFSARDKQRKQAQQGSQADSLATALVGVAGQGPPEARSARVNNQFNTNLGTLQQLLADNPEKAAQVLADIGAASQRGVADADVSSRSAAEERRTQAETLKIERLVTIRNDFDKKSEDFIVQRNFAPAILRVAERFKKGLPHNPADDFALLQAVGKQQDPRSTFREGELGIVVDSTNSSVQNYLRRFLNTFNTQGALTDSQRRLLVRSGLDQWNKARANQRTLVSETLEEAQKQGAAGRDLEFVIPAGTRARGDDVDPAFLSSRDDIDLSNLPRGR